MFQVARHSSPSPKHRRHDTRARLKNSAILAFGACVLTVITPPEAPASEPDPGLRPGSVEICWTSVTANTSHSDQPQDHRGEVLFASFVLDPQPETVAPDREVDELTDRLPGLSTGSAAETPWDHWEDRDSMWDGMDQWLERDGGY